MSTVHTMIPIAQARAWRTRGRGRATRHPVRLGDAGTGGRRVRAGVRGGRRRPHACAVSSCTTALHLALVAARRRPWRRGRHRQPFVHRDGERDPLLRRDAGLRRRRPRHVQHGRVTARGRDHGPRTKAILAVHQLGMPCDSRRSSSVARRPSTCPSSRTRRAPSAARFAGTASWEPIGRPHGDIACFSFHPRKLLSTGDGGMLTTRDARARSAVPPAAPARHERIRHGSPPGSARSPSRTYPVVGFNYRMTDIQARDRTRAGEAAAVAGGPPA